MSTPENSNLTAADNDIDSDRSCSASTSTLLSEVTTSTTSEPCGSTIRSTISKLTALQRLETDGVDALSLGSFEESSRLLDRSCPVRTFGKLLKKSLAYREVICLERMVLAPSEVGGDDSTQHMHMQTTIHNGRWLTIVPEVACTDYYACSKAKDNSECDTTTTVSTINKGKEISLGKDALIQKLCGLLLHKKFRDSILLLQDIVQFSQRRYGSKHYQVTTSMIQNIGSIFMRWGKFDKALESFHQARKGWIMQGQEYVNSLIICLNKEGLCLFGMGELVYAVAKFRNALDLCKALVETGASLHKLMAKIMNNIACAVFKMGSIQNVQNSKQLFLRAISYNTTHDNTICQNSNAIAAKLDLSVMFANYAFVPLNASQFKDACAPLKAALTIQTEILGSSHVISLMTLENFSLACANLECPILNVYGHLLDLHMRKYGDMHARTALVLGKIALAHVAKKEYSRAVEYLNRQLDCQKVMLSSTHPDVINTVYAIRRLENVMDENSWKRSLLEHQDRSNAFAQMAEII